MNQAPTVFRERTFYSSDPDDTRPLFQIPNGRRARMHARPRFLYGEDQAKTWLPELERIIQVHCTQKPLEMLDKERRYNPTDR